MDVLTNSLKIALKAENVSDEFHRQALQLYDIIYSPRDDFSRLVQYQTTYPYLDSIYRKYIKIRGAKKYEASK
jgi:hypothetical protein